MQIFIDIDSRKLIRGVANSQPVTTLDFKRGDDTTLEVIFVRSNLQKELATGTVIAFGVKNDGEFDGVPLVYDNDFTKTGTGATTVYTATPSFNTAPLNALLNLDSDTANDKKMVTLMGEITWLDGVSGAITSSETFTVRVFNDVIRGDEAAPAAGPNPIGTTAPTSSGLMITGTLTDGTDSVIFPELIEDSVVAGKKSYVNTPGVGAYSCQWDSFDLKFYLSASPPLSGITSVWSCADDVATPDLGTTWIPVGPATGTPVVAGSNFTASPPYFRVDGGFLYVQEAGVWKKVALSAL